MLDSDVFPNEFLEREILPTPENKKAPEIHDDKVNDVQEENQAPEEQVSTSDVTHFKRCIA